VILEFATPESPVWRRLNQFYCELMLPRLAAWISRDRTGAYHYLPRSIRTFERAAVMVGRLEAAGFSRVKLRRMNLGGVVLYRCEKPTVL
jgi:demethylmenaquinone methyltransferase/2-methoxy-6-polyprenyl-1,4-benzoquinol methylase